MRRKLIEDRAHLQITGEVQGVFFRASMSERAMALGLSGWVANHPDGGVEAVVEGPADRVDAIVRWCHTGPPAARVDDCTVERSRAQGLFHGFSIRMVLDGQEPNLTP